MHSAGVVRRIDDLGRVSIPKELRQMYQWKHNDEVEFFIDGNSIVLRKVSSKLDRLDTIGPIYADSIWTGMDMPCIICNMERVVACSENTNCRPGELISPFLKKHLMKSAEYSSTLSHKSMPIITNSTNQSAVIVPLTAGGEVIGAAIHPRTDSQITESSLNNFITVIKTLQRQLDA